jgi:flagella basal body P-ring formation protein FlgA
VAVALLVAAMAGQLAAVEAGLETALRAKHPDVVRFEISALDAERAGRLAADAPIVKLGARSAVAGENGRLVWFAVRGYRSVPVMTRTLAARTDLTRDDIAVEEHDVVGLSCMPLATPEAVEGAWTRRGLRVGDVLCSDALEPKPPVVRGAEVTVVYVGPRVRVTATARAGQDAVVGDRLAVRASRTGELYYAVASGSNEVTVYE